MNQPYPNEAPPKYSELPPSAHNYPQTVYSQSIYPTNSTQVIPILPTAPAHSDLNPIPNYGSTQVIVVQERRRPIDNDTFLCPACGVGILERRFTLLGFLLAILFFPFGIICLFILKKWKCAVCGISMGY